MAAINRNSIRRRRRNLSRFKPKTDYKKAFEEAVNEIIDKNIEDRTERIRAIDALIDEYVDAIGSAPDPVQLERLSNYILREELYDTYPDKVSRDEYPILSERQLARRMSGEAPLKLAEEVATEIGRASCRESAEIEEGARSA